MDWQNGGITSNNNGHLETLRMISFYGRINYSFNSKYLLQATIRRDGSSAFGKNNRWGTFPSASLAWRMSEEKFIKDLNVFDDLKFRVGYGVSGNSLGFGAYRLSILTVLQVGSTIQTPMAHRIVTIPWQPPQMPIQT